MEFFNLVIHGDVSSFWIPGLPVLQIKVSINGDFFYNVLKIWIKVFVSSILDSMWFVASRLTPCQNCSSSGTQRIYHLKRIRNLMEKSGIKISWPCARKWESKWWQKKVIHSTIWTSTYIFWTLIMPGKLLGIFFKILAFLHQFLSS